MKKIHWTLLVLFLGILLGGTASAVMRTAQSIVIKGGKVNANGVLGDSEEKIFIEFTEDIRVLFAKDHTKYEGEILPPEQIPPPARAPKNRMRPILTFELISNTADELKFIDKFDIMSDKAKLRQEILHPEEYKRTALVKIFAIVESSKTITDEDSNFEQTIKNSDNLALWEYMGQDEETEVAQWLRMGGKTEEVSEEEEDMKIFMSTIKGTGIFTIFDESPPPSFVPPFPIDQVQEAEDSPFPSVEAEPDELESGTGTNTEQDDEASDAATPEEIENQENDPRNDDRVIPSIGDTTKEASGMEDPTIPPDEMKTTDEVADSTDNNVGQNADTELTDSNVPPEAALPQSGQEKGEQASFLFPFILLNLLGLLGLGIYFSLQKKPY